MAHEVFGGEVTARSLQAWDNALWFTQARVRRHTATALRKGMTVIERRVKIYLRTFTHPEGTPTPSPPGGPPALVTGNLMRSWRVKGGVRYVGMSGNIMEIHGGPTAKYARIQELGGRAGRHHRSRLPKRPYVRPMVKAVRRELRAVFVEQWTKALRQP